MTFRDVFKVAAYCGAAFYFLDRNQGRRRRAFFREKIIRLSHLAANAAGHTARDLANRAEGVLFQALGVFRGRFAGERVLEARIRAQIGRYVSHPRSIQVGVRDGTAVLAGPILKDEVDAILRATARVKGVHDVENQLDVHDDPAGVPGLQGGPSRREPRFELAQRNWSPSARLLAGFAGFTLVTGSAGRLKVFGIPLGLGGALLLARALTNLPLKRLTGIGAKRTAIQFSKTITINAPVQRVFEFWSNFENFPKFMTHVRDVRKTETENQWHWTVEGPAGFPVEWNAVVTQRVPNSVIAWKTVPDSPVQHAGLVRFESDPSGATVIDVRVSYNPAAGAIGHVVAKLFGADPKKEIEDDLLRVKTFFETGKIARDAARKRA